MTDQTPNILEQLEREWRELGAGIRQQKLEDLYMRVVETAEIAYQLTDAERAGALAIHDQTDADFIAAIEGLTDEQWTFRPGTNRWSIQEVAEHAILVAALAGSGVEQALAQAPDPELQEPAGAFDAMLSRVLDRSIRRFDAPPPIRPQGRWTVAETLERFREVRGRARTLLQQQDLPLKGRVFAGMPGTFNCHHWLVLASLHTRRHLAQIAEVKLTQKSDGFPV